MIMRSQAEIKIALNNSTTQVLGRDQTGKREGEGQMWDEGLAERVTGK